MKRIPYSVFLHSPLEAFERYTYQFDQGIENIRQRMYKAEQKKRDVNSKYSKSLDNSKALRKMVRELCWHEEGHKLDKGQEEEWLRKHLDSLKR